MGTKISINPITRISGFMQIDVEVENHKIINAKCSGLLFRGFEKMLIGRAPLDATYFTERICGICSVAHSISSSMALESALKLYISGNASMLRDIIHGWEFIQNHLRHFYLYTMPDFAVTPDVQPISSIGNYDLRLPEKFNKKISLDYLEAVRLSRLAHQGVAILGGKAPHNHGIVAGGITGILDVSKLIHAKAIVSEIKEFIAGNMLEDVYILADYYKDYFNMGKGFGNLMSYGVFDNFYVKPGIMINGQLEDFRSKNITENIYNSWYAGNDVQDNLFNEKAEPDMNKSQAYSWVKAPRYKENTMEVGPLARMIISGNYKNRVSMMDRTVARVLETKKVIEIIENLLESVNLENAVNLKVPDMPESAVGSGLIDTSRGSLAHFISIENKKISHYNIITPSVWNCSPTDSKGIKGTIEQALMGTEIQNIKHPVEVGRIVRSFDPCISCATHVISGSLSPVDIVI